MSKMVLIAQSAKEASKTVKLLGQTKKNEALRLIAAKLRESEAYLIEENQKDVVRAKEAGMKASLVDRLQLTHARIDGMAVGLEQIADLDDFYEGSPEWASGWTEESPTWRGWHHLRIKTECNSRCIWTLL